MIENLVNSFKDIVEKTKDMKEYMPSFFDETDSQMPKEKLNINEPISKKDSEGLTDFQQEVLAENYGLSGDKIQKYNSWEDFEVSCPENINAKNEYNDESMLSVLNNKSDSLTDGDATGMDSYNDDSEREKTEQDVSSKEQEDTSIESNENTQYPRQEVVDGKTYYYDDNGKLYRVENDLEPNTEYEINGYTYKTDDQGRIISAEGTLRMKDREGRLAIRDSIEDIGKGDQRESDDRGHLIGDQFDGSNGLENMIPQDANINRNDFKNFENELAKEVKEGKEVTVKIEPVYDGDSRRPEAIVVTYTINGEESVRVFPNS